MSSRDSQYLQRLQNKCLKTILHLDPMTPTVEVHDQAGIKPLHERRYEHVCTQVYKGVNGLSTQVINNMFPLIEEDGRHTTRASTRKDLVVPNTRLQITRRSMSYRGPVYYNQLSIETRSSTSLCVFKQKLSSSGELDTG